MIRERRNRSEGNRLRGSFAIPPRLNNRLLFESVPVRKRTGDKGLSKIQIRAEQDLPSATISPEGGEREERDFLEGLHGMFVSPAECRTMHEVLLPDCRTDSGHDPVIDCLVR